MELNKPIVNPDLGVENFLRRRGRNRMKGVDFKIGGLDIPTTILGVQV